MSARMVKFDRSVSLLCWAFNEEGSIREYLERATRLMEENVDDYEIVLIDDGSTDRTYEIASTFQALNPKLHIYQNETNLNVGISSRRAIQRASKEFLFWQTIDWSYDIAELRRFLEYLRTFDIVQGVRRHPSTASNGFLRLLDTAASLFNRKHLTTRSDTVQKAFVSLINYILIRLLFRVPLSDYQNVTFYPTKWIQALQYESRSSFANPEGLIKAHWSGLSIKEVPIGFIPRRIGTAKGTRLGAIGASVWDIFRLWFKWVILKRRKPTAPGDIARLKSAERDGSS